MLGVDKPSEEFAEITLIGTGGGYGESCIIHLGNNNWLIVDSCKDPNTGDVLPLKYLSEMGVNLEEDVKIILCTHWHDDHIKGISEILKHCKNSEFIFARTLDKGKFLRLVSLDYEKFQTGNKNSSTIEFNDCLAIIKNRDNTIIQAVKDKIIKRYNLSNQVHSEVIALSPSDYAIQCYDEEISKLITEFGQPNRKIVEKGPNSKSVALFLKIGSHRIILGSDLEYSTDARQGWQNIIDHNQVIDKKSSLFKIPHHGSRNSYHENIWNSLLIDKPICKLTPWNRNQKLPENEMVHLFAEKSDSLYMTTQINSTKAKNRDRDIEKMIKKWNYNLREIKFSEGIIRCRIKIDDEKAIWDIKLFGSAIKA